MYRRSVVINLSSKYYALSTKLYSTTKLPEHYNEDYQYLQKSILPTYYFQPSLPRLPIPQLDKSCERYLAALRPILNNESYDNTIKIVENFRTVTGPQLQKLLKEHDLKNKHTNYISEPWFDMYLRDRVPLPINYNPLIVMCNDIRPDYNNQLIRSANIVVSSLRFMKSLRAGNLAPEVFHLNPKKSDTDRFRHITKIVPTAVATYVAYAFKAFPLDMSQYEGLFGATRIPELNKDRIYRNVNTKHLLVMRKGNFYAVDVLDDEGNIESPNVILGRLKQVLHDRTIVDAEHPVGCLTAANRNVWANLRQHLCNINSQNAKSLELIDSALFCLCLDDEIRFDENNPVPLIKNYLVGDAVNRWFDKSVSVFVGKDGITGINFEHSWGDGVAVLRYFNEICDEITNNPFVHPNTTAHLNDSQNLAVQKIEFHLDDHIKNELKSIQQTHIETVNKLNINIVRNTDINKIICKQNNISPDSIMQLSFQLAYKQLFGNYVGTYESCSTAAFRHGRTETMRPCTVATKKFCDAVTTNTNNEIGNKELKHLMQECSSVHGQLTKDAAMGQGFDRHLFGLKHIAEMNDMKIPSLYQDEAYKFLNTHIISTSTLSAPGIIAGSFGPVVKNGLGIGYSIQNDQCGAVVSSYEGERNGKEFCDSFADALYKIKNILSDK